MDEIPSYTLGELMSKSTTRAGRRSNIDKSDVSFYVNISYFEVAGQLPDELREVIAVSSTTSGENRISLPTDFDAPINVSVLSNSVGGISDHTLIQVDPSYVDSEGFYPVGTPRYYVLYGDFMELHPSPDSAYSLSPWCCPSSGARSSAAVASAEFRLAFCPTSSPC